MRMVFPHHTPGRFINELASDMNAIMGTILREESTESSLTPPMDIEETEAGYQLSLDVPGVNPDDIQIELEDGHVSVSGERHGPAESEDVTWRRIERSFGPFQRKFRLPKLVDQERIEANYEHGVLTVLLPKVQKTPAKRIVVAHSGPQSADTTDDSASS